MCFTLVRDTYTGDAAAADVAGYLSTDTAEQCGTPVSGSITFTWHNLLPGSYTLKETKTPAGYSTHADITPIVILAPTSDLASDPAFAASNLSKTVTANDPLLPGSLKIKKTVSGGPVPAGVTFEFRVQPCTSGTTVATCVTGSPVTGSPFSIDSTTPNGTVTVSDLAEGYYLVTEINIPSGYSPDVNPQIAAVHAGDVGNGNPVTVTFNNRPTGFSQLLPTQTTCSQFAAGTATIENTINYGVKSGKINNVAPGVLFYYTKLSATGTTLSFDMVQTQVDPNNLIPFFGVQSVSVFNANCTAKSSGVTITQDAAHGIVHVTISGTTSGQVFYANIKINPGTVVGSTVPKPFPTFPFTYATWTPDKATGTLVSSADGTLKPKSA